MAVGGLRLGGDGRQGPEADPGPAKARRWHAALADSEPSLDLTVFESGARHRVTVTARTQSRDLLAAALSGLRGRARDSDSDVGA